MGCTVQSRLNVLPEIPMCKMKIIHTKTFFEYAAQKGQCGIEIIKEGSTSSLAQVFRVPWLTLFVYFSFFVFTTLKTTGTYTSGVTLIKSNRGKVECCKLDKRRFCGKCTLKMFFVALVNGGASGRYNAQKGWFYGCKMGKHRRKVTSWVISMLHRWSPRQ